MATKLKFGLLLPHFCEYASAEACIGSGWFKVCGGISVSLPMRFSYTLTL